MDRVKIQSELLKWIEKFVEMPNINLGNWAPCPYARKARIDNQIKIESMDIPEWHIMMEFSSMAQMDEAFKRVAPLNGELEEKHRGFNQWVEGNIQHALYRDWPDTF